MASIVLPEGRNRCFTFTRYQVINTTLYPYNLTNEKWGLSFSIDSAVRGGLFLLTLTCSMNPYSSLALLDIPAMHHSDELAVLATIN